MAVCRKHDLPADDAPGPSAMRECPYCLQQEAWDMEDDGSLKPLELRVPEMTNSKTPEAGMPATVVLPEEDETRQRTRYAEELARRNKKRRR